ncbi:MAG: nucleotidyltransferase domain-containing protein [Pseudomonadota bacterium]
MLDHVAPDIIDAIDRARRGFYPEARAVFLYGSSIKGTRTASSDIDLFIVLPEGDELHERRIRRDEHVFQCTAVPINALPHLPTISLRARRVVGLIGLATGTLVFGDLPDLPDLQAKARKVMVDVNTALAGRTTQNLRQAIETAEAALAAAPGPGATALGLRAVPMLLEVLLQHAADDHSSSRSRFRDLARADPSLVDRYAAIAGSIADGDLKPLAQAAAELRAEIGPPPDNVVSRRLSLSKLMLGQGPAPQ